MDTAVMNFRYYLLGVFVLLALSISCDRGVKERTIDSKVLSTIDFSNLDAAAKEGVLDSLYRGAMEEENSCTARVYLLELATKFDKNEKEQRLLKLLNRVRTYSKEASDSLSLARSFEFLGGYYENKLQFDSTYFFYQQAGKWYRSLNDSVKIGEMALGKASILYDFGFYTEAEVETIRVLRYVNRAQNPMMIYESYQLLGLVLCELKSFEESLNYYRLTQNELQLMQDEGVFNQEDWELAYGALYNNFGGLYEVNTDYEQAIAYYQMGLDIVGDNEEYPALYSALLNNMHFSRMKNNDTIGVLPQLKKAEAIRLNSGSTQEVVVSKLTIGQYYHKTGQTEAALKYFHDAYDLAVAFNSDYDQKEALRFLAEHDASNKARFAVEYVRILDNIQVTERLARNKFARIAYETEEMINKNELLKERNRRITLIAALVVGVLMFLLVILRLRSRNKQLLLMQKQQDANQQIYQLVIEQQFKTQNAKLDERNRIAKELHDGIVNRIFTTRFNLMQLETTAEANKELLVQELCKAEEEVRAISHKLVSQQFLKDQTFEEVVKKLLELQQNEFGTRFELSVDRGIVWESIPTAVKMHLYRILQEALQNVNKYSHAKNCSIWILKVQDKIKLRISDDGIGFDTQKTKRGLGLKNLAERVGEIQGEFVLESAEGEGTLLEIVF
ncbi:ATP-binding protein [Flavobacterium sp. JP2137]|uniref:sensor histidine kinase n=1 Tax=Flavobacterium sp. JP2137 TaxID=3414510 RepID=UPI003D2FB05E